MAFTSLADAKFAAGIINEGMTRLGYSTESQIDVGDEATIETITAGMQRIGSLPADLVNPLLNQIDVVLIYRNYATMFTASKNPTRTFWRDAINFGGGEEDIYQEILTPVEGVLGTWAEDYADGDEDNSKALSSAAYHFGYHPGKVTKKFHTKKKHFDIAISLSEHEISKIFTPEGFAGYVSVRLANIQYSAEYALMNAVIDDVVEMANNNGMKYRENFTLNEMLGVTEFVEDVKMVTDAMKMPSVEFNNAGILTMSNDDDLFLVTTPEVLARVGTRGAENAYNLEQYMFHNRVIKLPAGTDLGTSPNGQQIIAVIVDKRAIVMALRYWSMRPFIPTASDFQNYFLKVEYIHGYNEFFNCVALCGEGVDTFEKKNELILIASGEGSYIRNVLVNGTSVKAAITETILAQDISELLVAGTNTISFTSVSTGFGGDWSGELTVIVETNGARTVQSKYVRGDFVDAGSFNFEYSGGNIEIYGVLSSHQEPFI